MFNNVPLNYKCPICLAVKGIENEDTWIKQADIFYRDDFVMGFISSKFIKGNEGHPLIVPNKHFENVYDLPEEIGSQIFHVGKKIAIALKKLRNCDGVNLMQFNEPVGDQHAFHYHLHIIPRFEGDDFHEEFWKAKRSNPKERILYA
ncbi:MAG: HIT domain-containing protein [Candidatus Pacebacteria bacterium]|nr:HIT domain-containing protein [Candidatus Paceibacterota bacterium]